MNILEKIKKLLEEGKTEEANALLVEHTAKEVEGLKNKNEELLGRLKKEKEGNKDIIDRLKKLETEKEDLENDQLNKTGDVEKITASLKNKYEKQIADLTKASEEEIKGLKGQLSTHVVDGGLTNALTKAGVKPELMDAARALIKSQHGGEVGDNDGTPFAKFDGKAVKEFVTDWAKSDSGKHFVTAQNNSGGGSNGANDGGKATGAKTRTRSEHEKAAPADQAQFFKEGGTLVDD